jgi:hypothetical protein
MKPSFRTKLGIALFVPLAAVLLATFACLPAPVGDPETAKVDEALNGAWQHLPDAAEKSTLLALIQPWDGRTYLLEYLQTQEKEGKKEQQMMRFKAWVTRMGTATFLTCQPMNDIKPFADTEKNPRFWMVFRVELKGDALEARMVSPDSTLIKEKNTRQEIEEVLKANLENKELYGDPLTFKRLGANDAKAFTGALEEFKLSEMIK